MRFSTALFAGTVMGFLSTFTLAQDAAKPDQPEGQQAGSAPAAPARFKGPDLLRAADARISKARSISYKATSRGVGAMSTRSPEATGTVLMIRDPKAAPGFRFSARGPAKWSGERAATRDFSTAFDGKVLRTIHEADKMVMEAPWSASTDLMDEGAGWVMTWALQWKELITDRFNEPEMILPNRVEGEAVIFGVPCHVVYVDYSELSNRQLFDVWWYLGKEDSLPRRVDMHLVGAGGDGFTVTEIEQLELDPPVSDAQLALAVPEGYRVEKAKEPEARRGVAIVKAAGPQVGQAAPDWTLKDASGQDVALSDLRGKIVVMDFWATWCHPCREVMPGLQKLHENFKDKGVVVLGMNCWESGDAAAHMKDKGFTYGLILNADSAAKDYGVSGIPTLYIIGPDGKVAFRAVGSGGEQALESAVSKLVKP